MSDFPIPRDRQDLGDFISISRLLTTVLQRARGFTTETGRSRGHGKQSAEQAPHHDVMSEAWPNGCW